MSFQYAILSLTISILNSKGFNFITNFVINLTSLQFIIIIFNDVFRNNNLYLEHNNITQINLKLVDIYMIQKI